ncbi:unnamed protein product [Tuber aestivum]|uniref:Uncharacterized protein n=1 Tax=Tuber aestivum TaxID=59557 RepID=A0A292Q7Y4_9PEZI|nr:unnamed protein product [Tuber aestivum]
MVFSAFISAYANPLSTCAAGCLGSAAVVWSTNKNNGDRKKDSEELRKSIEGIKEEIVTIKKDARERHSELKANIKELESKFRADLWYALAISSRSPLVPLNCPASYRGTVNKWVGGTEKRDMSEAQQYEPVTGALETTKG